MEAPSFASDSSLGSLSLQAWAESRPHSRLGLFSVSLGPSWVRLGKYSQMFCTCAGPEHVQHHRHQQGPFADARGCPCVCT